MRKKYEYFVNGVSMKRKEFVVELKNECQKVVGAHVINEDFSIDLCDFDEAKFKETMKSVEDGVTVIFIGGKTYRREEK